MLDGEDWFELSGESSLPWSNVQATLDTEQRRLADAIAALAVDGVRSSLTEAERFDLVLGITCHAIYHAGQVQLIKRMIGA